MCLRSTFWASQTPTLLGGIVEEGRDRAGTEAAGSQYEQRWMWK